MSEIVASLFGITYQYLIMKNTKEAKETAKRIQHLEREYYAEENKPLHKQSHSYMDNIVNELCLIAKTTSNSEK